MKEEELDYDGAVMLLAKGDTVLVRSSANLDSTEILAMLAAAAVALNGILEDAEGINHTKH